MEPQKTGTMWTCQQELFFTEWLLGKTGTRIQDKETWEEGRGAVKAKYGQDMPVLALMWRWLTEIECRPEYKIGIKVSTEDVIPYGSEEPISEDGIRKANEWLARYQKEYGERISSPYAIEYPVGRNCSGRVKACITLGSAYNGRLFEGQTFYLPRASSKSLLEEWDKTSTDEILIKMHGGTITPRESDIDKSTIVLATADPEEVLLKLLIWHKANIYEPSIVRHCVKEGKGIDDDVKQKFGYSFPFPVYGLYDNFPWAYDNDGS